VCTHLHVVEGLLLQAGELPSSMAVTRVGEEGLDGGARLLQGVMANRVVQEGR